VHDVGTYIYLLLSLLSSSIIDSDAIQQPKWCVWEKKNKNNVINRFERIIYTVSAPFLYRDIFFRETTPIYNINVLYTYYTLNVYGFGSLGGFAPTHSTTVSDAKKNITQPFKCRDKTKTSTSELGGTILLLLLLLLYYFYYTMCCWFRTRALSNSDPHKLFNDFIPL